MNSRFNYVKPPKRDSSKDDVMIKYSFEKKIRVLSNQKDGSAENYVEESFWKEDKSSWEEFIKSYDIGSPQEQVMNHLSKGTPLITAHTLPSGDYSTLEKGAEIKREMAEKGITLEMLVQAISEASKAESIEKKEGVE